ncbi:MAG: hypothetical protein A2252_12670 [Elusimicrobia bacterium RIFOXYA2_FULL_39_19]|nr:MAG: hypothetical protein A2252_12670 [Elusimicrobia bacterium RIFOXYA2_FULL_39_19]
MQNAKNLLFLAILVFAQAVLTAQPEGSVQLSYPTPNPVNAGEHIILRTTVLNQSTQLWEKTKYHIQIEIYNSERKYIGKVQPKSNQSDILPGSITDINTEILIPASYNGDYFYKIVIIVNNQHAVESELFSFRVIAVASKIEKPLWEKFGGRFNVSLKNTDKNNWNNLSGGLNVDGITYNSKNPTQLFLNTYHTSKSSNAFELKNEIFSFLYSKIGENYALQVGDILPDFSKLALYKLSIQGIYLQNTFSKTSTEFLLSRTEQPPQESGITSVYERWMGAGKIQHIVSPKVTLGLNYVSCFDKKDTIIKVSTQTISPTRNTVYGLTGNYKLLKEWEFEAEAMYCDQNFDTDFMSTGTMVNDYGIRLGANHSIEKIKTSVFVMETRPNFYSYGSPFIKNDRRTFDIRTNIDTSQKLVSRLGYNQWIDNLSKDISKLTITQKTYDTRFDYKLSTDAKIITLGYSFNEAFAQDRTRQDNYTNTFSIGFSNTREKLNWSATFQKIDYTDKMKLSDDIRTLKTGFTIFKPISTRLNLNTGINLVNAENTVKKYTTFTQYYSASILFKAIPDFFNVQLWTYYTIQKNNTDLVIEKIDFTGMNSDLECSFKIKKNLTWVIGTIYELSDSYNSSTWGYDSNLEKGVLTRFIIDF